MSYVHHLVSGARSIFGQVHEVLVFIEDLGGAFVFNFWTWQGIRDELREKRKLQEKERRRLRKKGGKRGGRGR